MRLIDADALLIKIDEANYTAIDIKNLIAEAQTVEQNSENAIGVVSFSNHSQYVSYHTIKVLPDGNYHVYTSPPKRESAEKEKTELQAQINELRESIGEIRHKAYMDATNSNSLSKIFTIADTALAKTAPQCLIKHDNEVIEKYERILDTAEYCLSAYCYPIKDGDEVDCVLKEISALKGKQNEI